MMKMNSLQLLLSKDSLKGKLYLSWKTKKNDDKTEAWINDTFLYTFILFYLFSYS